MTKSEKRAFRIYATRGSGTKHLFLQLFDLVDNADTIDDQVIMKKMKIDSAGKYTNMKRHLYSQILSSLRMLNVDKKPNIKIREYIDMAYVLYNKGLYLQALGILKNAKQLCHKYGTDLSLLTILEIEKNIHSRHITRTEEEAIDLLMTDTEDISQSISNRVHLTNLKINLHRIYVKKGHVKNNTELNNLTHYFNSKIEEISKQELGMMEQIYYNQCHVWYNYVIADYTTCLKYSKKWVDVFTQSQDLQRRDYNLYLRGYHYVLTSAYNLLDFKTHNAYLEKLEIIRKENYHKFNKNNKIFSFLYVHTGRFNNVFLSHDYQNGIKLIPNSLRRLKTYRNELDLHKVMVLHYKIAWMYLCAGKAQHAIPYLEQVIALRRKSLREDIQSYARIMHLMTLFDLSDYNGILKLLRKYKYFFEQVKEKNQLQTAALKYFYKVSTSPILDLKQLHRDFYQELIGIKKNTFERRAFLYLDIIYWVKDKY